MNRERFQIEIPKSLTQRFREVGLSDVATLAVQGAVRIGARRILDLHGASAQKLNTTFKAEAGMTPVTLADLESGTAIKNVLFRKLFVGDYVHEEESGEMGEKDSKRRWYIDPLDGTSSFTREQRYSTVGAAMYEGDKPFAATICNPFERELLVAEAGKGTFLFPLDEDLAVNGDPKKLEVSQRENLIGGVIYLDALFNNNTTPRKLELIKRLVDQSGGKLGVRMTGSNIDQQRQVAAGRGDLTITDAVGGFYDLASGSLIIREAGGLMVGLDGKDVNEQSLIALAGNKKLVDIVLPVLQECYEGYKGFK